MTTSPPEQPDHGSDGRLAGGSAEDPVQGLDDALDGSRAMFRPHTISLGNDGLLEPDPHMAGTPEKVRQLLAEAFRSASSTWPKKRLVLYAHGGLVAADGALNDIEGDIEVYKANQCYLLAFIWRTGLLETFFNIMRQRFLDSLQDQAWSDDESRDRCIESFVASSESLLALWQEMKENAEKAFHPGGGGRLVCDRIAELLADDPDLEIHLVGHSAGAIFHSHLLAYLTAAAAEGRHDLAIRSCTLLAPACSVERFRQVYEPAIRSGRIERFRLFTLTDEAEREDCVGSLLGWQFLYRKSLLYLVANGFEAAPQQPLPLPLLGMARHVEADPALMALLEALPGAWQLTPSSPGSGTAHDCSTHGGFSTNPRIRTATVAFIQAASAPLQAPPG